MLQTFTVLRFDASLDETWTDESDRWACERLVAPAQTDPELEAVYEYTYIDKAATQALVDNNQSSGYVVYYAKREPSGNTHWVNIFADTYLARTPLQDYFTENSIMAPAVLVVAPAGANSLLGINVAQTYDGPTIGADKINLATWQQNVNAVIPAINVAAQDTGDGQMLITATASRDLTGQEVYWENTAGVLDRARSVFDGTTVSVRLTKPISTDAYKVKIGYKYYKGVAEVII